MSVTTDAGTGMLQDGKWHMITLSSLYDGTRGYAMFIDGKLTAVLNGNQSYTGMILHFFASHAMMPAIIYSFGKLNLGIERLS